MEIWGKVFLILSSGLFLLLFLVLFEHPKRNQIGVVIFIILSASIIFGGSILPIVISILSSPLIIFLDTKRIGWQNALIFVISFIIFIPLFYTFLIDLIPIFLYPVLVFVYVLIAHRRPKKMETIN